MTRWIDPQPAALGALSSLGLPPLVERMLLARGIGEVEAARRFLHPDAGATTPYPGIQPLVERVQRAIRDGESICVWGEFDVDGQTSTAVLVQALQLLGARVRFHVPIRSTEGHGVHIPALQRILDDGVRLVITCDTGITAHEAVAYARDRGVDFLITDHHDLGETLPDAHAIIDPKMLPSEHPLADLAGVGVAYKLAGVLLQSQGLDPDPLLDLVAMGLLADLALLKAETRLLTQRGILGLRKTERLGLRLLAGQAGAQLDGLTEETIGFALAPRLNALGRLGDANAAVDLLLLQDEVRGRVLALQIEGLNTQRRLLTAQVFRAAEEQLVADPALLRQPILLLEHPSWPGGVLGIVALSGSYVSGTPPAMLRLQRSSARYYQRPDATHLSIDPSARSLAGWNLQADFNKNSGKFRPNASVWAVSPGYEVNDLGFQTSADRRGTHAEFVWQNPNPDRFSRFRQFFVSKWYAWNGANDLIGDGLYTSAFAQFRNYWSADATVHVGREASSDRLTRGGPLMWSPGFRNVSAQIETDQREAGGPRLAEADGNVIF